MGQDRFVYVKYDDKAELKSTEIRAAVSHLEDMINHHLPDSREKSLVLTKIEEAFMWSGKAIRNDQISRGVKRE